MTALPTTIAPGDPSHASIHNATNAAVNAINTTLNATVVKWGDGVTGGNGRDYISVGDAPYSATLNGTADASTAIQAAVDVAQGTNGKVLVGGLAGISKPIQLKSEMTLESLHYTRWPYPSGAGTYTPKSGLKVVGSFVGDSMLLVGDGINNANIKTIEFFGNSIPASGTQIAGICFEGLARSIELFEVGVLQPSGHGFLSRAVAGKTPRGINFRTTRAWGAGNATGANADGTQWGYNLVNFTDSSIIDSEAKDSRNGGFKIDGPGDTKLIGLRAPFNRGGPGYYITGGDPTLATGNGGLSILGCSSDYSYGPGLFIDATGRQVINVSDFNARRDGVDGASAAVKVVGTNSSEKVCPVLFDGVVTEVEDDDTNNGVMNPVTGLLLGQLTQMSLSNCHIWGRTTSISQGTGSTGGLVKTSGTNWFYTGVPTGKTVVNPTIT